MSTSHALWNDAMQPSRAPLVVEATHHLDPETRRLYIRALQTLRRAGVEFLVGGAHALHRYTGIGRDTKDLDVFLRKPDCQPALAALEGAGFKTDVPFPHWLAKAHAADRCIDIIFGSGNGVAIVDDLWFTHAVPDQVFGVPALLCPVEEMIWSKAFIMERERYDGADIAHLLLARGRGLDWPRLVERFGPRWRVLLSHLVLFGFIYPDEGDAIPGEVLADLLGRMSRAAPSSGPAERVCDGTLLSRQQYLADIGERGYADGRLAPRGHMTAADIAIWTAAISATGECEPYPASPVGRAAIAPNGRSSSRARRRRR
jgi:hypothetical protein